MTRRLTLLFAAFEAALVVGIGIAIPLVPLTVLWAVQYGFGPDWLIFWRASVDSWLIGHGVDVRMTLDPVVAAALGVSGPDATLVVTIAALGFALLTVLLGVRAGARVADTGRPVLGWFAASGVFGVLSALVTLSSLHEAARPSIWQGAILPTGVFALGLALGVLREITHATGSSAFARRLRDLTARWPSEVRATLAASLRAGTAAAAIVLLVSALTVAVLIVVDYAELVRLYEGLHGGYAGGAALTAGQLALLPNLVIWAASWFIGPGFAIGTGSSVSPVGTHLGPIPALPVLGALPADSFTFGFAGLIVPIAAGFLAGIATGRGLRRALDEWSPRWWIAIAAVGAGIFGGLLLGLLAWASAGAAGPGRLHDVGPDPVLVGLIAAGELTLAIGVGLAAGASRRPLVRMPHRGSHVEDPDEEPIDEPPIDEHEERRVPSFR